MASRPRPPGTAVAVSAPVVDSAFSSAPEAPERASDVVDLPRSDRNDWVERVWQLFVSLKLMVVLMALFALAMAAGTFLNPKEDALADIERAFAARPWVVALYRLFELYAPFRSWWFTLIIVLLALNNLASSIERLPRIFLIVRRPQRALTDGLLRGLRHKRQVPRAGLEADRIAQAFAAGGYRVTRTVEDGVTHLFGERGAWSRFGVWVVHLALLVVCAGALYGRTRSFEGTIDLPENGGQASFLRLRDPDGTILQKPLVDEQGHRFGVRCDDFTLDRFKDGSARRFSSELVVVDDQGNELHHKRIIVNDPLDWGGMKFYQASYTERPDQSRAAMTITDRTTGESKAVTAAPEQPFFLGDGRVRYTVVNFDRAFGELGPAVQVQREEASAANGADAAGEPKSSTFWVFANYPAFDQGFRGDRFGLRFDKLEPLYVSGIQVGYDPGVPWIYLGCVMLWSGLFVAFWSVHRRVWARVEDGRVVFAGAAHRHKDRFARDFEAMLERLGAAPQAPRTPRTEDR